VALDLFNQRAGRNCCDPARGKSYSGNYTAQPTAGFDKAGAFLIFTGLASLLFAVLKVLHWDGHHRNCRHPCVSHHHAVYFIWHELRVSDPLLELRLFKNRNFLLTNLIMSLVFFSFAGISYLLPFYLQYVKGYGASDAGLILTALSVAHDGIGYPGGHTL